MACRISVRAFVDALSDVATAGVYLGELGRALVVVESPLAISHLIRLNADEIAADVNWSKFAASA